MNINFREREMNCNNKVKKTERETKLYTEITQNRNEELQSIKHSIQASQF